MSINLTQKERMLLEDQKEHEKMCIQKYKNYAEQAKDPQLKQQLQSYANQEQQHLNTLNELSNGQVPNMNQLQNQNQQNQQNQQNNQQQAKDGNPGMNIQNDSDLCTDLLMTEKYVSGTYDTAIFEFQDPNIRQVLNHIQKEEQQHGEGIFNYMKSQGMYNPQ